MLWSRCWYRCKYSCCFWNRRFCFMINHVAWFHWRLCIRVCVYGFVPQICLHTEFLLCFKHCLPDPNYRLCVRGCPKGGSLLMAIFKSLFVCRRSVSACNHIQINICLSCLWPWPCPWLYPNHCLQSEICLAASVHDTWVFTWTVQIIACDNIHITVCKRM